MYFYTINNYKFLFLFCYADAESYLIYYIL